MALINLGQIEEGVESLSKAVDIDPENSSAYNNIGLALNLSGCYQGAIGILDKALKLDSHNYYIHNNLGFAYNKLYIF